MKNEIFHQAFQDIFKIVKEEFEKDNLEINYEYIQIEINSGILYEVRGDNFFVNVSYTVIEPRKFYKVIALIEKDENCDLIENARLLKAIKELINNIKNDQEWRHGR